MSTKVLPGIRRTRSGWEVYVRVQGQYRSKHYPANTDIETLIAKREKLKMAGLFREPPRDGSFGSDCLAYLKAVAGMPTFKDRAYRIEQWKRALGSHRDRASITSVEVRQVLEDWRQQGLSHGSLNLRRTALSHLFSTLDPKGQNPVKDVPRYREEPMSWNLPTPAEAARAISRIGRKHHGRAGRARLAVLMWTGWPPTQLMRLTRADVDWQGGTVYMRGRLKGKGSRAKRLPLLPKALAALRRLDKADAWGTFNRPSLGYSLHRACDKAGVHRFRIYDLRHLFLSTVALAVKDDRIVAELAMHTNPAHTRRYTEQSVPPRLAHALALVQATMRPRRSNS